MLQWMGGSRRKVTTSRKSTEKRQKQYFEQRKRQEQQQQDSAFAENHVDGFITCDHQKRNRSLDISSLLNVSKVTEECKPLFESVPSMTNKATCASSVENVDPSGLMGKSDIYAYSARYHTSPSTPAIANEHTATEGTVPTGTRITSLHQMGRSSSKGSVIHYPRENTSTRKNLESEYFKSSSSIQPSIFEIISDDGAISTTENKAIQEAHVAFSIEGLGKVGTETPMQSPQHPRSFGNKEQSSFTKAAKKLDARKNFNLMLDDLEMDVKSMMEDEKSPSHENRILFSCTDPELLTFKDGMQLDGKQRKTNSLYHEDKYDNFWNDSSSCLESYQDDDKCGGSWKRYDATNNSSFWRNDPSEFEFERGHSPSPPRCQEKLPDQFDNIDGDRHFASFDKTRYSSFKGNYHPEDCFAPMKPEKTMASLTSFSGESCSSTAVGDESTADMPSARLRRRYSQDLDRFSKSYTKEAYDEGMWNLMAPTWRQEENCEMYRKHTRPNPSHSNYALYSQAPTNKCEGYQQFEEEFSIPKVNSHPQNFFASSKINQHQRGDSLDRADSFLNTETDFRRSNCLLDDFEKETPNELSSENFEYHQPYCSRQSYKTSFIPKAVFGEPSCEVFEDIESAFPAPELSAEGSAVQEGGDRSKNWPPCPKKIFQVSTVNKNTRPESRLATEERTLNDHCYGGRTNNGIYQEVFTQADADTDAEETSLSVKLQHESDDELNTPTKELQGDIPVQCQQKIEDNVTDGNSKGPKPKTTLIDPCYQLLTVEKYVFKLFSVPKGEAAAWSAVKLF